MVNNPVVKLAPRNSKRLTADVLIYVLLIASDTGNNKTLTVEMFGSRCKKVDILLIASDQRGSLPGWPEKINIWVNDTAFLNPI